MESAQSLSSIERTSLFTMECRTFFERHILDSPDAASENLLRELGGSWDKLENPLGLYNAVHLGRRYRLVLEWIRQELEKTPELQIVNLGCGVEHLCHRLPAGRWSAINLDFNNAIDFRRKIGLDPANVENRAISLLDPEWFTHVNRHRPTLIVLTGVAPYLAPRDLEKLFAMMGGYFPRGALIIDGPSHAGRFFTNLSIRLSGWTQEPFRSTLFSQEKFAAILPQARVVASENLSRHRGKVPHHGIAFKLLATVASAIRLGTLVHIRWGKD